MKLNKTLLGVALAAATMSTGALALPTIKNVDNPGGVAFTGFDWASAGQAWITGYNITNASPLWTSDNFQLQFQAAAASLNGVAPANQTGLNTTYEYTLFATAQETATCVANLPGGGTCDLVSLDLISGVWSIYYDTTKDANYAAGTGFTDGILLLSGTFTSATPVIAPQGATNPGNASVSPTLTGQVATTNVTYVNPMLAGTTASSTLQFGNTQTGGWVRAAAFNGVVTGGNTNTSFQAQADANQSFTAAVPEPDGLALAGLALAVGGIVGMRRRRD